MHGTITVHPTGSTLLVDVETGDIVGELTLPPDLARQIAGHRWRIWDSATRRRINGPRSLKPPTHKGVETEHRVLHQAPRRTKVKLVFDNKAKTAKVVKIPDAAAGLLYK